jgi:hypothetical protein
MMEAGRRSRGSLLPRRRALAWGASHTPTLGPWAPIGRSTDAGCVAFAAAVLACCLQKAFAGQQVVGKSTTRGGPVRVSGRLEQFGSEKATRRSWQQIANLQRRPRPPAAAASSRRGQDTHHRRPVHALRAQFCPLRS